MTNRGVDCSAPPERLWELVAKPDQWHRWSLYVRGAEDLGSPEVEEGAKGRVVLRGGIRLPVEITFVDPGRSWSWRIGGIVVHHIVTSTAEGSRLEMPVESSGLAWTPAAALYAPVVALITRRIVQIAERDPG